LVINLLFGGCKTDNALDLDGVLALPQDKETPGRES